MKTKNMSIVELHNALVKKELTFKDLYKDLIKMVEEHKDSNFIITFDKESLMKKAEELDSKPIEEDNLLYGIPYFAKDNFSTKGIQTTSGSKILEGFKPTYNSTVVDLFEKAGTVMSGKVSLDELGMGGTGLLSAYGMITNPKDNERLVGGSSSGSVYAVAVGIVPFATGSDTGDSIRKPASFNGLVGYKPTYGAISRYGMMPYAPSLDHAGIISRTLEDAAIASDAIVKKDNKDFTSIELEEKDFFKNLNNFDKSKKIGYIKRVHENLPEKLKEKYDLLFDEIRKDGVEVVEVDFRKDLLDALASVYMMISFSEAVSTNANLDGINFGVREPGKSFEEIMRNTRTNKFGHVVKRRFIIGSLNLKKEYQEIYLLKAKKVRRLITEEIEKMYQQIDMLIIPPALDVAPYIDNAKEFDQNKNAESEFLEDILTLGNFSGMPSITIPFLNKNGLGIGINVNTKPKHDLEMFQAAKYLESKINGIDKEIK